MKLSALLAPLIAAKASHATIMEVVLAFEAEQVDALARRRESDAKRQANKRERDSSHVMSRDVTVTVPSHEGVAHVEDNLPSKKISGKEENKKTPRDELAAVLDAERADAVVEHRQRLRKPLTSRAAKMLAVELAKAPDANAAADLMLAKGWAGFDVGWLEGRTAPRATSPPPPPKPRNPGERAILQLNGTTPHEPPSTDTGRLAQGQSWRQAESAGDVREIALPPGDFSRGG